MTLDVMYLVRYPMETELGAYGAAKRVCLGDGFGGIGNSVVESWSGLFERVDLRVLAGARLEYSWSSLKKRYR